LYYIPKFVPLPHLSLSLSSTPPSLKIFPSNSQSHFPPLLTTWFPLVSCLTKSQPEASLFFSKKGELSSSFYLELLVICFLSPQQVIQECGFHRKHPSVSLFGFEILTGEQIHFSSVRSEREKDQSSDQQDYVTTIRSHRREIDGGDSSWGSGHKLNFLQVLRPQSLRIIDLAISTDQQCISIPL
jgi:hypothetical protein